MNIDVLEKAAQAVRRAFDDTRIRGGLILGSGLGELADIFPSSRTLSYSEIPGLGTTNISGHDGQMSLVSAPVGPLLVFQGRRHWYEGMGWEPVAIPVFLCREFGADSLILTNAAGAIQEGLRPGTLMLIADHINAMGVNPLAGEHLEAWGPRFPDCSEVYDRTLRTRLAAAARAEDISLIEGVYLGTCGPGYETPAEVRAYRAWGADAVGMSTVPEAILAHGAGLRVAGLSCITNFAAGTASGPLHHDEVLAQTRRSLPALSTLFRRYYSNGA